MTSYPRGCLQMAASMIDIILLDKKGVFGQNMNGVLDIYGPVGLEGGGIKNPENISFRMPQFI